MVRQLSRIYDSMASPEKLFAIVNGNCQTDLITEYLNYECVKSHIDKRFDLNGDRTDHLNVLYWYITEYAMHRRSKVPLSMEQISYLNSPIPIIGLPTKISLISYSFIRNELGRDYDLNDIESVKRAIYWWCVEKATTLNVQDILIPEFYVSTLNETSSGQQWEPYNLNFFLHRYHSLHPELSFLKTEKKVDRAAFLVYAIMLCGREPHLVRFLPRDSVGRLLALLPDKSEFSLFDSVLALLPGPMSTMPEDHSPEAVEEPPVGKRDTRLKSSLPIARNIREQIYQTIGNAGYSLRTGRRITNNRSKHSAVCYDHRSSSIDPLFDGISVIGPLQATSGLGQATRLSVAILKAAGHDVSTRNFMMDNPAPIKLLAETYSEMHDRAREINLIHLNAETVPLAFAYLNHMIYRNSYNIGYFFWELDRIPPVQHLALKMLDEIWVSSEYNRETYSRYTNIPVVNVGMAAEQAATSNLLSRADFGVLRGSYVFLSTFDSFSYVGRKNPVDTIKAFQLAFCSGNEDVVLIIKTQNRSKIGDAYQERLWSQISTFCDSDPRILLINETLDYSVLMNLKSLCDCYVSLHRSEGWGFGIIEAMQLGLPVIATGYSGNMEFCNADNCFLVEYELVEPRSEEYIFVQPGSRWAQPSITSAAKSMRLVFTNSADAKRIAVKGRELVRSTFSISSVARRYDERLRLVTELLSEHRAKSDRLSGPPGVVDSVSFQIAEMPRRPRPERSGVRNRQLGT